LGLRMTFTEEEVKIIVECLRVHLPLIHSDLARRVEEMSNGLEFVRACPFGNWCSVLDSNFKLGDCFFGGKCGHKIEGGEFIIRDAVIQPDNKQVIQWKAEAQLWKAACGHLIAADEKSSEEKLELPKRRN